ncbi:enoyl-CoA hydratase-related protein [Sphingobium yanoikuyae]|uniref:Crotonase n=1 Tax=Sphingobium yanoikuyae TaxID=13690 RepID=A0A430C951_SPHYA|nr:enoyl-CoA hydratase-related protein [Sphingobium yanoikuyae]RSU61363.1 crotonase [Sphingobium yanoikuyae]
MASVELEASGHIAHVRLNRPSVLNAIDSDMERALAEAWTRIDDDPDIRVAVLTGAGDKAFCAGGDMSGSLAGHEGLSYGGGLTGIGGHLRRLRKPLICAVHGHVLGLGFELAMCADILLAADNTRFRLPESRAGIIDHCGVVHRAIRQLPYHIAMAMIVTSEPLDAGRALQFGLVNEIFSPSRMAETIEAWTTRLLKCSPLVSQAAKQAAIDGLETSLPEAVSRHYPLIERYRGSLDCKEAADAWRDRRDPQWSGR